MKDEEKLIETMDTIPVSSRPSDSGLSLVVDKGIYDALWGFVMILPRCDKCDKVSTRKGTVPGTSIEYYTCDSHEKDARRWGVVNFKDLSWSDAVRNLYTSLKNAEYETLDDAANEYITKFDKMVNNIGILPTTVLASSDEHKKWDDK